MAQRHQKQAYPMACRSINCGELGHCPATCPHLEEKQAFCDWVIKHQARQVDPIWAPTIWQATI